MDKTTTMPTGEELLVDLGVELPQPAEEDPPPAAAPETPEEGTPPEPTNPEDLFKQAKENKAFADLRIQNKNYANFIGRLATALNLQSTEPDAIMESLQQTLLEKEAEAKKLPVDVLERMQKLEQQTQVYQTNELKQNALIGFNAVKEQFKLDDNGITEFAKQLNEQGINPFTQQVDLITHYKMLNFEKLMEDAEQRGIQQESSRAGKAATHSTQPGKTVGSASPEATSLSSLAALNSFLDKQGK